MAGLRSVLIQCLCQGVYIQYCMAGPGGVCVLCVCACIQYGQGRARVGVYVSGTIVVVFSSFNLLSSDPWQPLRLSGGSLDSLPAM